MPNSRGAIRSSAERLKPRDRTRIARALEVVEATGRSLTDWHRDGLPPLLPPGEFSALFLAPERDELYARIDARFDAMLDAGALEEVAALAARKLDPLLPAMKAHGVPALIRHLRGEITLDEAADDRPRRHPPLRQAAVHLVPAPAAGIRMGEAGGGEGVAPDRHSGALRNERTRNLRFRIERTRSACPGMTAQTRMAGTVNSLSPNAGNPAKLRNRAERPLALTFQGSSL